MQEGATTHLQYAHMDKNMKRTTDSHSHTEYERSAKQLIYHQQNNSSDNQKQQSHQLRDGGTVAPPITAVHGNLEAEPDKT